MAAVPGDTVYEVRSVRIDLATKLARVEVCAGTLDKNDECNRMLPVSVRLTIADNLVASLITACEAAAAAEPKLAGAFKK